MEYDVLKLNYSNGHVEIMKDKVIDSLNHTLNHMRKEEGYQLKTIIPHIEDGTVEGSYIILEKEYNEFISVICCDISDGNPFFEYQRTNVSELLQLIKNSEEFEVETNKGVYKGKFVKSQFKIEETTDDIYETLYLYFDLTEKPTDESEE
ncbi:hypothetical protein [Anoxybacteroides rupiense]|uniref:hypothetical protein n=1 Tax=Anoxybacteroides rupiense TaxID=311460 RepID=UPI001F09D2CB|nr:hypothetical protein [Anoxybacillus rupiensis]